MTENNNGAGVQVRSVVAIVGTQGAQEIVQEITLTHEPGVPDNQLIGQALVYLRNTGGLLIGAADGSVTFYPFGHFSKLHFSVRRVVIARPKTGLQLVQ